MKQTDCGSKLLQWMIHQMSIFSHSVPLIWPIIFYRIKFKDSINLNLQINLSITQALIEWTMTYSWPTLNNQNNFQLLTTNTSIQVSQTNLQLKHANCEKFSGQSPVTFNLSTTLVNKVHTSAYSFHSYENQEKVFVWKPLEKSLKQYYFIYVCRINCPSK